ncbi:MAG: exodeoxyribonuclease III [Alphaproteobacteria bacterium]|nr:exodeoxyribonuclease III [Alphaproteobacteria bacterium]
MKILSWNVNSVRVRQQQVEDILATGSVDIIALQETKCSKEDFPTLNSGFEIFALGNKGLSGVAFVSRIPFSVERTSLPQEGHQPARFLHVIVQGVHLINVYVPNGESLTSDKFVYKKTFMQDLASYLAPLANEKVLVMGDFNIVPSVKDVYAPEHFSKRLLFSPAERQWLSHVCSLGFMDVGGVFLHNAHQEERYTWWDYRNMADFPVKGLRIDLMLATYSALDCITGYGHIRAQRQKERPSDHIPVWSSLCL